MARLGEQLLQYLQDNYIKRANELQSLHQTANKAEIEAVQNEVSAIEQRISDTKTAIQDIRSSWREPWRKNLENAYALELPSSIDTQMLFLIFYLSLFSDKGRQAFLTIRPLIEQLIHMINATTVSMFSASSAHPAVAMPAFVMYTNILERLYLVDHPTAVGVLSLTEGFTALDTIMSLFKTGVQTIGFDMPKYLPSGASQPRVGEAYRSVSTSKTRAGSVKTEE